MDFFLSSRRLHTRGALVTGVQTCALPIYEELCWHRLAGIARDWVVCAWRLVPTLACPVDAGFLVVDGADDLARQNVGVDERRLRMRVRWGGGDRKSTRLSSRH